MNGTSILKDKDFSLVSEVHADGKKRVLLKRVKKARSMYRVYENALGQIILDPVVVIPASEAWLFENKQALDSVRQGLKEASEGKVKPRRSYAAHADEPLG